MSTVFAPFVLSCLYIYLLLHFLKCFPAKITKSLRFITLLFAISELVYVSEVLHIADLSLHFFHVIGLGFSFLVLLLSFTKRGIFQVVFIACVMAELVFLFYTDLMIDFFVSSWFLLNFFS